MQRVYTALAARPPSGWAINGRILGTSRLTNTTFGLINFSVSS
jgi:hypothetical protein